MKNLPFFQKLESAFKLIPEWLSDVKSDFENVPQDALWILFNFGEFRTLQEDIKVQKDIIEYFKDTHPTYCLNYFSRFPALKEDHSLQRELIQKNFDHTDSLKAVILKQNSFPVLQSDSSLYKSIIFKLLLIDTEFVFGILNSINVSNPETLHEIEKYIVETLMRRDYSSLGDLYLYWNRFSTMTDHPEIEYDFLTRYIHNFVSDSHDFRRFFENLEKFKGIHSSEEWSYKLAVFCFDKNPEATSLNFFKFKALRGNAGYQLKYIKDTSAKYKFHYHISHFHRIYDGLFDAVNEKKFIMLCLESREGTIELVNDFDKFLYSQDDRELQELVIEKSFQFGWDDEVWRNFDKYKALKGDLEYQEMIFLKCMSLTKYKYFGHLNISKFDTLGQKSDWLRKLAVSYTASIGCFLPRKDFANLDEYKSIVIDAYFEALVLGNWEQAKGLLKYEEIRNEYEKSWKKMALDLIEKREQTEFDVSFRKGWYEGESHESIQREETFWIRTLKSVLSVNKIHLSDEISKTFSQYRNSSDETNKFLIGLLHNGQTITENIFSVIRQMEKYQSEISLEAQKVIKRMANSPFKGFSERTFEHILSLNSTKDQDEQLKKWASESLSILDGMPLLDAFRSSEFYHEMVFAAYRPKNFSMGLVKQLLNRKFNSDDEKIWMRHVNLWNTQVWKLFEAKQYRLKRNKSLDESFFTKIQSWFEILFQKDNELDVERFCRILFSTAKGKSFQPKDGDLDYLFNYILQQDDHSLTEFLIKFSSKHSFEEVKSDYGLTHQLVSNYVDHFFGDSMHQFLVREFLSLLENEDENIQKWMQNTINRLKKGSASAVKKFTQQNVNMTEAEVYAEVLANIFMKSSALDKEKRFFVKQIKTLEPVESGYSHSIDAIMTKSLESILSKASAGLCTSRDYETFTSKDFLQINLVDKKAGLIVGNIQLHLFGNNTKVLARLNPTSKFLESGVDQERLAIEMMRVCQEFADLNCIRLFLPEQCDWHQLTNRDGTVFHKTLEKFFGKGSMDTVTISQGQVVEYVFESKKSII